MPQYKYRSIKNRIGPRLIIFVAQFLLFSATNAFAQGVKDSAKISASGYVPFKELESHFKNKLILQQKKDSLKFILRHRWAIGIRYGQFIVPGYVKADELDPLTNTDIAAQRQQWVFYTEYYLSEHWAVGFDVGMHKVEQFQKKHQLVNSGGISVTAGGGMNLSILGNAKYIWGRPPSADYGLLASTNEKSDFIKVKEGIADANSTNNRRSRKLRFYNTFGAGVTQSALLKVKGNPLETLRKKSYMQTVPTAYLGLGIFSRLSRNLQVDLATKYVVSGSYDPTIGSVKSYSGFNVQLSIGILFNTKYQKIKRELNK